MEIEKLRKKIKNARLNKSDVNSNPFEQFNNWIDDAVKSQIIDATSMSVSTSVKNKPSSRMVLFKGIINGGITFYTNYESRKATEIEQNKNVALLFYWEELERQIRIEGVAEKLSEKENDEYFKTRPLDARIGAWASKQSRVLQNRSLLLAQAAKYALKFGINPPKPEYWGGYRVIPNLFEFWQGRGLSRLHDRIQYSKNKKVWKIERLYP